MARVRIFPIYGALYDCFRTGACGGGAMVAGGHNYGWSSGHTGKLCITEFFQAPICTIKGVWRLKHYFTKRSTYIRFGG